MCVIYDRLTKAPFSFGLPTCALTHEQLFTPDMKLVHSLSESLSADKAKLFYRHPDA